MDSLNAQLLLMQACCSSSSFVKQHSIGDLFESLTNLRSGSETKMGAATPDIRLRLLPTENGEDYRIRSLEDDNIYTRLLPT